MTNRSYEPVLSSRAAEFLVSLSKARQRKLIKLLSQLAPIPTNRVTIRFQMIPHAKCNSSSSAIYSSPIGPTTLSKN